MTFHQCFFPGHFCGQRSGILLLTHWLHSGILPLACGPPSRMLLLTHRPHSLLQQYGTRPIYKQSVPERGSPASASIPERSPCVSKSIPERGPRECASILERSPFANASILESPKMDYSCANRVSRSTFPQLYTIRWSRMKIKVSATSVNPT